MKNGTSTQSSDRNTRIYIQYNALRKKTRPIEFTIITTQPIKTPRLWQKKESRT